MKKILTISLCALLSLNAYANIESQKQCINLVTNTDNLKELRSISAEFAEITVKVTDIKNHIYGKYPNIRMLIQLAVQDTHTSMRSTAALNALFVLMYKSSKNVSQETITTALQILSEENRIMFYDFEGLSYQLSLINRTELNSDEIEIYKFLKNKIDYLEKKYKACEFGLIG